MFEKFGGGETGKQGQAVETSSCQTNNVGQFRQAFGDISERLRNVKVVYIVFTWLP